MIKKHTFFKNLSQQIQKSPNFVHYSIGQDDGNDF